jgi:hypothetical protein
MVLFVDYDQVMQSFVAVMSDDQVIRLRASTWADADAEADALDAEQELVYDEF